MADKRDLDFTYSMIDKVFRLSIGEMGDFSGARYNGNFSMTLEEAQRAKHQFIVDQLGIKKGTNVLDMCCGWGPFLNFIRNIGAKGIGLTLAEGQVNACRKNGLDVYLKDVLTVKPADHGIFDAITAVGGFEHFCTLEDYKEGRQEEVYRKFFKTIYELLPTGGRFYMQTMVFGKNMIAQEKFNINADKNSDEYICAVVSDFFPGSWLPYGSEMVTRNAEPLFKMINISSGRLDYIETTDQWVKKVWKFDLKKYLLFLRLLPQVIFKKEFRIKLNMLNDRANKKCFEREIMDHFRIVFEKVQANFN